MQGEWNGNGAEDRLEPVAGNDLRLTLDMEIQQYAQQLAYQTLEKKIAKKCRSL